MKRELVTGPAELPVSREELRDHLWTIFEDTLDSYLDALLKAATSHVETITGLRLVSQSWRMYLQEWPARDNIIELPFGRATAITGINWLDSDGADHTLVDGVDYLPAVIGPEPHVLNIDRWPSGNLFPVDPIRILWVAGFGAVGMVPEDLRHAIRMLAAHWYEIRESVITGTIINKVPMAFDALVDPWRMRHV